MNLMKSAIALALVSATAFSYSDTLQERFEQYMKAAKNKTPGIGVLKNEINYKGLTVRNFQFDTNENYTIVSPGQTVDAQFEYEIDSSQIKNLHLHHFIYGLYPDEPIGCLLHSLGFKDSKGKDSIQFQAPKERGIYRFQVYHSDNGLTFKGALNDWKEHQNTSNNTTIGIVIVE